MKNLVLINVCEERFESRLAADSDLAEQVPVGPHIPLGLVSIATYLKERMPSAAVSVFNQQILSVNKMIKEIEAIKPDIVGIGCSFRDYTTTLILAQAAKNVRAKVLLGGHHATALRKEIMLNRGPGSKDYCVDAVIQQDGEEAFFKYAKGEPLKTINNLVYSDNGKVVENPVRLLDLDDLASPDMKLIDIQQYFREYRRRFPSSAYKRPCMISGQKGCAWRSKKQGGCSFCSMMGKILRMRHPKKVWDDIDELVRQYRVDYIWDVSDSLLNDKEWFRQFCEESAWRPHKPFLKIYAKPSDLIDENTVRMLADLNVVQIFVGFESNDDHCLADINKGTNSWINERAVSLLDEYKIQIRGFFILGMPGETLKSLLKTATLAEKILGANDKNLVFLPMFVPVPKSLAYKMLLKKTGKKYIGKDDLNWQEIILDWTKYFCRVSYNDLLKTRKSLQRFPYDITSYSY